MTQATNGAETPRYRFRTGTIARWGNRTNPVQRTPAALFRQLDDEFRFTLDAAASDVNHLCARYYTVKDDALGKDWGTERVWLNPPFGKGMREWARKAYEASRNGALVVMLVPSATDMDWWHDYILEADEIRFVRGRLYFHSEDMTRTVNVLPNALAVFRPRSTGERLSLDL